MFNWPTELLSHNRRFGPHCRPGTYGSKSMCSTSPIAKGAVRPELDHCPEVLVRMPGTFPGSTAVEARSAGRFTAVHDA
ncbi:hypothetical protein GCM10010207_66480 [Streptomyces atratus]|nr:hypothetical protein GCM10010207_66480 [Streptomyces atratus]